MENIEKKQIFQNILNAKSDEDILYWTKVLYDSQEKFETNNSTNRDEHDEETLRQIAIRDYTEIGAWDKLDEADQNDIISGYYYCESYNRPKSDKDDSTAISKFGKAVEQELHKKLIDKFIIYCSRLPEDKESKSSNETDNKVRYSIKKYNSAKNEPIFFELSGIFYLISNSEEIFNNPSYYGRKLRIYLTENDWDREEFFKFNKTDFINDYAFAYRNPAAHSQVYADMDDCKKKTKKIIEILIKSLPQE